MNIEHAMQHYLALKQSVVLRPDRIVCAMKNLIPVLGEIECNELNREHCLRYTNLRCEAGRVTHSTARKELGILRTAIFFSDPTARPVFQFPPAGKPRDRYLTIQQCQNLINASQSTPHIHLFVLIALSTGARRSAILELTWDAVSFERGTIDFSYNTPSTRCKTRSTVPIGEELSAVLLATQERAETNNVIEFRGKSVKSIKTAFRKACARAGIHAFPHLLRHTFASQLIMNGGKPLEVAKLLGHSDARTTERIYAKLSTEHLRKTARLLPAGMLPSVGKHP